tara:strand:+ start:421 stop:744 length:324 start_codon:yes stop_codon:yes gene_type:complete
MKHEKKLIPFRLDLTLEEAQVFYQIIQHLKHSGERLPDRIENLSTSRLVNKATGELIRFKELIERRLLPYEVEMWNDEIQELRRRKMDQVELLKEADKALDQLNDQL